MNEIVKKVKIKDENTTFCMFSGEAHVAVHLLGYCKKKLHLFLLLKFFPFSCWAAVTTFMVDYIYFF